MKILIFSWIFSALLMPSAFAEGLPSCPALPDCASAKAPDALADWAKSSQESANKKFFKAAGHPNVKENWIAAVGDFRAAYAAVQKDVGCLKAAQASTCTNRLEPAPESEPGKMSLEKFEHKDFSEFIRKYRNAFNSQMKLRDCLAAATVAAMCAEPTTVHPATPGATSDN